MQIKRILFFISKAISSLLLILILLSAVAFVLEIRVPLNFLNKPLETAVEQMLDRDFSMQGDVTLMPGLWPALEINNVSISNSKDRDDKKFAHFGRLFLQLSILPLFYGELYISEMLAEQVTFNLESDLEGNPNWRLGSNFANTKITVDSQNTPLFHFKALEQMLFENINIHYIDQKISNSFHFNLQQLEGRIVQDEDIVLTFSGKLQDKDYSGKLTGGGLDIWQQHQLKWPLSLQLLLAGTPANLSGYLKGGQQPEISARLEVGKNDIGKILDWFEILDGLDMGSEQMHATILVRGDSLSEMLTNSELSMVLEDAFWHVRDNNTGAQLPIKIKQGSVDVKPGKPVQVKLEGKIDKSPVNIDVTGASLIDYTVKDKNTPLMLLLKSQNSELTLRTRLSQATSATNLDFDILFKGNNLSHLNQLVQMDLPPLGPYQLEGFIDLRPDGYQIRNLKIKVRESQLAGSMALNTLAKPPKLTVDLNSPQIQLDDFEVGNWSPTGEGPEPTGKRVAATVPIADSDHSLVSETLPELLSYEALSRYDVVFGARVLQVLSGNDKLGNGSLSLKIDKARLSLNLENLTIPGGDVSGSFFYHPFPEHDDIGLVMKVENFDYGILARRIDPDSSVAGLVSLDINLSSSQVKDLDELFSKGQGTVAFLWSPEALDAELFEMWAVNLMSSLLKKTDKNNSSKINCVIGDFSLEQGIMEQKLIFADTTKMRLSGIAKANFNDQTISVQIVPKAKRPEFFSLATPVK